MKRLPKTRQDLLIIGGGIVGSGIARDAAMRGLRVGLVEQHDFASGTSSRSSRIAHWRDHAHLAQGWIGLVHEASVEKKIIHQIAPHLSDPLAFIFPTYRDNKNWVLWQLKIGVKIYDLLCSGRNLGKSSWLNPKKTLEKVPGLNPSGLTGAVRYFDGLTNDARLVMDTLRSAAHHNAILLNYCRFLDAEEEDFWECELEDTLSSKKFSIRAKTIVNATGPWADELPHSCVELRLAKGIHLVVDRSSIPMPDAVVMTEGKRILFRDSLGASGPSLATDGHSITRSPLDKIFANASDIRYVLDITNHFFPGARLSENDVISSWAGVRPLIANPNGSPSDISRSHEISNPEPGWWDVAGGKLTTYRLMAEQTVDKIAYVLKKEFGKRDIARCRTAQEPLLPRTETEGLSGILPGNSNATPVKPLLRKRMGGAFGRRHGPPHKLALLFYRRELAVPCKWPPGWASFWIGTEATRAKEIARYYEFTTPSKLRCNH